MSKSYFEVLEHLDAEIQTVLERVGEIQDQDEHREEVWKSRTEMARIFGELKKLRVLSAKGSRSRTAAVAIKEEEGELQENDEIETSKMSSLKKCAV